MGLGNKMVMMASVMSAVAFGNGAAIGQAAEFVSCPAPIAQCVAYVSGWCEKEPNGKITVLFPSRPFSGDRYRQCVQEVVAKRGQQKAAPKR